ncbi:hypothetical protein HZA96_03550 [Candidatus Woesearchaeota archaeon]|nr:hypothetical protein [Candidatus Woesearchaeota archaeon]
MIEKFIRLKQLIKDPTIPKEHKDDEWIVVIAYYAMYMAALSLIAKENFLLKVNFDSRE